MVLHVEGDGCEALDFEAGGQRVQRIPPTERQGRVHSSTVTVAVLDPCRFGAPVRVSLSDAEIVVSWFSGTGCGGQHRNKHQNSCRLRHIPTGLVFTAQTRSRETSLRQAKETMIAALAQREKSARETWSNLGRKAQIGSGESADRRRLWAFQRGVVTDQISGKSAPIKQAMSGGLDLLWT